MIRPTDLILVAVLKDRRDLEIARVLGWYRIPVKTAPRTVNVDWLVFYQTAKFGDEKWAINYVARVRGHELATRAELLRTQPDHPRANDQYFKLQLGPLTRLPRPIPSRKWRRITFLYTTGERLTAAEEINDLVVQSVEREMLYRALRERGMQVERDYPLSKTRPEPTVDLAILGALGNLGILFEQEGQGPKLRERPGWTYLYVPEEASEKAVSETVERVASALKPLSEPDAQQSE